MPDQQTGELTAQEGQACVLRATGKSKSECYRLAFDKSRAKPKSINDQASRLFRDSRIQSRVRQLLEAATVASILPLGECLVEFRDFKAMAVADRNHNALTSYKRMELQMLGLLKDTVSMTVEQGTGDDVLLQKLGGKDKDRLAALQAVLGAKEGFDA